MGTGRRRQIGNGEMQTETEYLYSPESWPLRAVHARIDNAAIQKGRCF
jgi:hypothetical protein